jgi:hypothetical protein
MCRDPDDDEVLALAIAAKLELIVSGDNDLLWLSSFEGVPIAMSGEAVNFIEATGKTSYPLIWLQSNVGFTAGKLARWVTGLRGVSRSSSSRRGRPLSV